MAFSLWPMWCLVCGHLVHAMRQVAENDAVNPIDNMFCECKEVQSVEGCPDYGNTKFGLSSGIPRYYHEQAQKKLCCRMSTNSKWKMIKMWKKKYIRQDTKDLCLEERRPLTEGGCCTVEGSAEIYGEDLKLHLTHAKVYSMAHKKMNITNGNPTEEDYKKKSKVFIETDSIGYATSYARKQIPADKIIPDIKKLMKTRQKLQCKEDFEGVKSTDGWCKVQAKPICCCTEAALKKDLADNTTKNCIEHECAPKTNYWQFNAKGIEAVDSHRYYIDHSDDGRRKKYVFKVRAVWGHGPAPFYSCPAVLKQKEGNTFAKKSLREQAKLKCTSYQEVRVDSGHWNNRLGAWKKLQKVCVQKAYYEPRCKLGWVEYRAFNGQRLEGALHCPAGYKSNIPNDRFDSKCNCDSQDYRDSETNAKITLEVP